MEVPTNEELQLLNGSTCNDVEIASSSNVRDNSEVPSQSEMVDIGIDANGEGKHFFNEIFNVFTIILLLAFANKSTSVLKLHYKLHILLYVVKI